MYALSCLSSRYLQRARCTCAKLLVLCSRFICMRRQTGVVKTRQMNVKGQIFSQVWLSEDIILFGGRTWLSEDIILVGGRTWLSEDIILFGGRTWLSEDIILFGGIMLPSKDIILVGGKRWLNKNIILVGDCLDLFHQFKKIVFSGFLAAWLLFHSIYKM